MFRKLYGNAIILKNLHGQTRIPYLPVEEVHKLRDKRLRSIIAYAAETVPYYQALFKEIDPHEIKTVQDLDRLPLIDKDTVRKSPHSFVSTSRAGKKAVHFQTSGTTGKPLDIYHDVNSILANIAFGERERAVYKTLLSKSNYKEIYFGYATSTLRKVREVYSEWTFLPIGEQRKTISVVDPFESLIQAVNRYEPTVITGYGSFIEMFFKTIYSKNIKMFLPKVVLYAAESMTTEGRNLIEEIFKIPLLSRYNAVEVFKLGYLCELRKGFHIHEDLCDLKIINAAGKTANVNEKGEVVISNLVNRATVLLNYRLGDVASFSDSKCSCGRTSRVLSELEGRVEDMIFLPDGKFIHPRAIWNVFKGKKEVLQYQFIQHEPQRFELKLSTTDKNSYDTVIPRVVPDLKSLVGHSSTINCEFHDELGRGESKFRMVISHCKPND
jgi:phenylacetate-CoA ligase